MKKILTLLILLYTQPSFACPSIEGNYFCPEKPDDAPMINFIITKSKNTFCLKGDNLNFEIDQWNIDSNEPSDEFNFARTMAKCNKDSVDLLIEAHVLDEGMKIFLESSIKILTTPTGIQVTETMEGFELDSYHCLLMK